MSKFLTAVVFLLTVSLNVSAELSRLEKARVANSGNNSGVTVQTQTSGSTGLTRLERARAERGDSTGRGAYLGNVGQSNPSSSLANQPRLTGQVSRPVSAGDYLQHQDAAILNLKVSQQLTTKFKYMLIEGQPKIFLLISLYKIF